MELDEIAQMRLRPQAVTRIRLELGRLVQRPEQTSIGPDGGPGGSLWKF